MPRLNAARIGLVLAAVLLGALVVVLAVAMRQGVGGLAQGRTSNGLGVATDFTLPQFDGQSFVLSEKRTQPVFLYFWASWCLPCKEEAPVIEKLWPEYRERGWTFVGVNIWDAEQDARRFAQQQRLTFPLLLDGGGAYINYGVQSLPTSFFIRSGGQIHARYDGSMSEAKLRSLLDETRP